MIRSTNQFKFIIKLAGDLYGFELYNAKGDYIYDLMEAIHEAEEQYPNEEYEIYNGIEGFSNFKEF